jgi:hypothetical protein
MKYPKLWAVLILFALRSLALAQSTSNDVEQIIKHRENQIAAALLAGDVAASEKYLAANYVRVYPDGAVVATDDLKNGIKFTALDISAQKVHIAGSTAVSVFRSSVKATVNGQPIDGDYVGIRTWAKELGDWKIVAFTSIRLETNAGSPIAPHDPPKEHAHVKANVLTDDLSHITLTLDPKFQFLGKFPFDIRGVAGGYRYLWGETDHGRHLRRTFIVQVEGYYEDSPYTYTYGTPNPATLAGDTYQHNISIYDNDQYARENPGTEAGVTRDFFRDHGYEWEPQAVMSRFARIVDSSGKNEIIFFYFENLADYSKKHVADFPEERNSSEQKAILDSVDANSRKAFTLIH